MEMQEFIENFAAQFDDTDAAVFTAETQFRTLDEWSSLIGLSVIAMCAEEYGVILKGDDIKSSNTIQDIYDKVQSKL